MWILEKKVNMAYECNFQKQKERLGFTLENKFDNSEAKLTKSKTGNWVTNTCNYLYKFMLIQTLNIQIFLSFINKEARMLYLYMDM